MLRMLYSDNFFSHLNLLNFLILCSRGCHHVNLIFDTLEHPVYIFFSMSCEPVTCFGPAGIGDSQSNIKPNCPIFSPSEVNMAPKRMLTGALLLVVAQPSLSSPYVLMMRQASPLLYPASYLSSSHQTLYTGMFSPWSSFYFPSVATQRNTAPAAHQAPATTRQLEANTATDGTII